MQSSNRSDVDYYLPLSDKSLVENKQIYSEEKEQKKITLDYLKEAKLAQYPFDPCRAFEIRLLNFANGAIYAIKHKNLDISKEFQEIKSVKELVTNKLNEFKKLEGFYATYPAAKPSDSTLTKILYTELNRFYAEDLPKAAGLSLQEIGLGEAMYTWEYVRRPVRVTRHRELIPDSKNGEHLIIEQIEEPFSPPLTSSQKEDLVKVHTPNPPRWFTDLPKWAQRAVKVKIPKTQEDDWSTYENLDHPTVLRKIPGAVTTTRHRLVIKDEKETILLDTRAIRHGAPTSFGMKNAKERQHSATENLRQVLSDQCGEDKLENEFKEVWGISSNKQGLESQNDKIKAPILVCSLLTPRDESNFIGRCIEALGLAKTDSGDVGGTTLVNEKNQACQACDSKKQITSINFAVNAQKKLTAHPLENFIQVAESFHQQLTDHVCSLEGDPDKQKKQNRLKLLNFAISTLKTLLEKIENRPDDFDDININLYCAALCEIIIRLILGLPLINCKSSKDRTGCELTIADAILIDWSIQLAQRKRSLCFSAIDKKKRPAFLQLVRRLYATGHQLWNAHDNSPGAPGIKDEGIFSKDMQKDMEEAHELSKEIAKSNKPRSLWQKNRNKIWRGGMLAAALLLGVVSVILILTGKLSPLGLVAAKGANIALNTAGWSLGGVTLAAGICKGKEIRDRRKSAGRTFKAELARIEKQSNKISSSTYTSLRDLGGTAELFYKKPPAPMAPTPFGLSSLAWRCRPAHVPSEPVPSPLRGAKPGQ